MGSREGIRKRREEKRRKRALKSKVNKKNNRIEKALNKQRANVLDKDARKVLASKIKEAIAERKSSMEEDSKRNLDSQMNGIQTIGG